MFTEDFREHLNYLKKKDEIAIKKAMRRLEGKSEFDRKFARKVYDIYEAFRLEGPHISKLLKDEIDNPLGAALFNRPFSQALVCSVLYDTQFVAVLMCSNLLRRTANLNKKSSGALRLRVYTAILNYDSLKKQNIFNN